jgi:hypothetical protein
MQDWLTQIIIISCKICSHKLLLFQVWLVTRIIIISSMIGHINYYYFVQDLIAQIIIISCKIWSHKLLLFQARFDRTNLYYFMQDLIAQIIIISSKIWSHKLLLFQVWLITQIIIISYKIDHTNNLNFIQECYPVTRCQF